ncbi:MAG: hypothetical protein V3T21_02475 [Candidatus Margulisiibacteriota bacterium]
MDAWLSSFNSAWSQISPLVLNLILVLILILAGVLIARGLGYLTTLVLKTIRLDKGAKQIGFDLILEKGGIKKTSSELLGDLVYWVLAFVVVIGVLGGSGLAVEPVLTKIFSSVGIIFLAALILGIGLFLASLISGIVRVILANLGLEGAKTASRVVYYIVIVFAFLTALAELGVSSEAFVPHLGVIIGAPALAVAIAFGLGCKDMAADFLHNLFKGK